MQQKSRRTILIYLAPPGTLTLIALITIVILLSQAPDTVVMQWSSEGASRYGNPAELLFVPLIAFALSIPIWAVIPAGQPQQMRIAVTLGNALNAGVNTLAIMLLAMQLERPLNHLPGSALLATLIPAAIVGVVTFLLVRPHTD